MASFSIDDVRETFQADISQILGRVETVGRALLAREAASTPVGDAVEAVEALGDCFHSIYGTTTLVGAKSLAGTAQRLEGLAEASQAALRRLREEQDRAWELAALCVEGARRMRSMLALELDHERPAAERVAEEFLGEGAAGPGSGGAPAGLDEELMKVFREEAREAAAEIEARLQALSERPDDFAAASRIEQIFHSLKGAAATVGLEATREAAARLQLGMQRVLEGDVEVDGALLAGLRSEVRQLIEGAERGPLGQAGVAAQQASGPSDGGSMRSELLDVFREEARASLAALRGLLQSLAAAPHNLGAARDIERLFHTLKGAAATVGLAEISRIAASMQARMEAVLEGAVAITPAMVREIVAETNALARAAGVGDLALEAESALRAADSREGGQETAHQVFSAEARQICQRALALARELPHVPADKARAGREELGRIFHRLKGSALVTTDPAVAVEAERLQRRCAQAAPQVLAAEVDAAVRRLASLLQFELTEASHGSEPLSEASAPARVREAVKLPDPELWESFTQECTELLEAIDRLILDLESSDQPKKLLESLLRQYHTLKGAANTVGLGPTGRELHRVEDFLESLVAGPILPSMKAVASFLLWVQADARRQLKQSPQGWVEVSFEAVEAGIRRALAGGAPVVAQRPSVQLADAGSARESVGSAGSGPEPSREGADRKYIRVGTERLDALMNLAGELVVSRSRLVSRVATLGGLREELALGSRRLLETVDRFREKHEFSTIGGRPAARLAAPALPAPDTMQRAAWGTFTELELDHYDDVNVLARGLAEITDDLNDLNGQLGRELAGFSDDSDAFGAIVNGIQGEVTRARMVPLELLFSRLRLPVRDAAERDGKEVRVVTSGEDVSLDKAIADALFPPMLHLVRNAVAHGVESADRREQSGKARTGVVTLGAREESGQIILEVRDDGAGLDLRAMHARGVAMGLIDPGTRLDDPAVKDLVFAPGFSTRATAGSVSGRGVGCDVARRAVERLNGSIRVESRANEGTTFVLSLPVTLAITKALLVRHRGRAFALPLHFADRIVDAADAEIAESAGARRLRVDGAYVPIRRMDALLRTGDGRQPSGPLVVLRLGAERVALQVDALAGQEEVVVKSAGELLAGHPLFAGVTIRGTGELALILDVPALLDSSGARRAEKLPARPADAEALVLSGPAAPKALAAPKAPAPSPRRAPRVRVLFVDDSLSVRRVAEKMLAGLGAEVTLANDGHEALARLREKTFDIVFTDLEMPRMHGYDLIRELRFLPAHKDLPVVVVSSRSGQKHQDQARALGANDYLTKPFSPQMIEGALRAWCGSASSAEGASPAGERPS